MIDFVMLAGKCSDVRKLTYPVMVSPKLDGIRGRPVNREVLSRTRKALPNRALQSKWGLRLLQDFDGEFILNPPTQKNVYNLTQSVVMSEDGDASALQFHVFDYVHEFQPFHKRYEKVQAKVASLNRPDIVCVPHDVITNADDLEAYEEAKVKEGYEGVMIRHLLGPYKFGRSTEREGYLLKLKRFEDSEFIITGFTELHSNTNAKDASGKRTSHKAGKVPMGVLGSLLGQDIHSGKLVDVGTGFTAKERAGLWKIRRKLVNKIARYSFMAYGTKDKPRIPVWGGFRDVAGGA